VVHNNPGGFVVEVSSTPRFRRPPVIETLLAMQFAELEKFAIPHFGLFWSEIRDEYPRQEVKPPLAQEIEQFGGPPTQATVGLKFSQEPEARCWFISEHGDQLIQVHEIALSATGVRAPRRPSIRSFVCFDRALRLIGRASSDSLRENTSASPR
jgi:hypothetical protein